MIRKLLKSHFIRAKTKRNFWTLPFIWGVYISYSALDKSILVVILRGYPTLYDRWFTRYGKSCVFVSIMSPNNKKNVFLGSFRLSEGYKCLRLPTINHVLRSFWEVSQLSTTSGSWDMDFRQFRDFWDHFLITKSILKIDPLRIPKQLLSGSLQKLDDHMINFA